MFLTLKFIRWVNFLSFVNIKRNIFICRLMINDKAEEIFKLKKTQAQNDLKGKQLETNKNQLLNKVFHGNL